MFIFRNSGGGGSELQEKKSCELIKAILEIKKVAITNNVLMYLLINVKNWLFQFVLHVSFGCEIFIDLRKVNVRITFI